MSLWWAASTSEESCCSEDEEDATEEPGILEWYTVDDVIRQGPLPASTSIHHMLRNREIGAGVASRVRVRFNEEKAPRMMSIVVRGTRKRVDISVLRGLEETYCGPILCCSPDGDMLVRSLRVIDKFDGINLGERILNFFSISSTHTTFVHSLYAEEVSLREEYIVSFAKKGRLAAGFIMDIKEGEVERSNGSIIDNKRIGPYKGPLQGLFRVDILVPWANAQITSINGFTFALRLDRNKKQRKKRFFRVHSRGVAVNCGYQIIFLTVTPQPLLPFDNAFAPRRSWNVHGKRKDLGVVSHPQDPVVDLITVDIGESISGRYAYCFLSREMERGLSRRLQFKEIHAPDSRRKGPCKPIGLLHLHAKPPEHNSSLYMTRQTLLLEPYITEFLGKWWENCRKPEMFATLRDYEPDILHMDDDKCKARIGVTIKAEVTRGSNSVFYIVFLSFDWYILDGWATAHIVDILKRVEFANVLEAQSWYRGCEEEVYEAHELEYSDASHTNCFDKPASLMRQFVVRDTEVHYSSGCEEDEDFNLYMDVDPEDLE